MLTFIQYLKDFWIQMGVPAGTAHPLAYIILILLFFAGIYCIYAILKRTLIPAVHIWSKKTATQWDDALCAAKVPERAALLISSTIASGLVNDFFAGEEWAFNLMHIATELCLITAITAFIFSILNAIASIFETIERLKNIPLKGFFQAIKILICLGAGIWILSILSDKSPAYFLSGLGALMAILLLVFKDTLLGFTAGILISVNDLVRNGDWIEVRGTDADGSVIDISLTTIKVKNWDNTISNIPAYTLISSSFKNWRGMECSGGRRIKRAVNIDMQTIHFASAEEITRWSQIDLLRPYLEKKQKEIQEDNSSRLDPNGERSPINIRRLTNIGTFRAYCLAYLQANPKIHQNMTLLVRQLDPSPRGLPLEIYVFTNDTKWANYEGIQSDIFDHILSILPEFGLSPFQEPSGKNFETLKHS